MSHLLKLDVDNKPILVTGAAGFIGFHLAWRLLDLGYQVVGIDNYDPYYDVSLKKDRTAKLQRMSGYTFVEMDLADLDGVNDLFALHKFRVVVHLAAQAGVRYSLVNPRAYLNANFIGFFDVIEACRVHEVQHLVYASSSSVYGLNTQMPFSVHDNVDHPISLYAASKKSNELLAHSYSHLFGLKTTGLRFFTVYGPWGRPDMALFKFCRSIQLGEPIDLYNNGDMKRDFTYVEDIIQGVLGVMANPPQPNPQWEGNNPDPSSSPAPYRTYNIGAGQPVQLRRFLELIEENMGKSTKVNLVEIQPGDVPATWADVEDLVRDTGYQPKVSIEEGIANFVEWFKSYYAEGKVIPKA